MPTSIVQAPYAWNAVGNPINYRLQRKDLLSTGYDNSGALRLQFAGDVTANFALNDSLYIKLDSGVVDGIYKVTNAPSFSGGTTYVLTSCPYPGGSSGPGYVNLLRRLNYSWLIRVFDSSNVVLGQLEYAPPANGFARIDISTILKNLLTPQLAYAYGPGDDVINLPNVWTAFKIGWTQQYVGGSGETEVVDTNVYQAMYVARQIGGTPNLDDLYTPVFKFLSKIKRMWVGWPNLVTWLMNAATGTEKVYTIDAEQTVMYAIPNNPNIKQARIVPNLGGDLKLFVAEPADEVTIYSTGAPGAGDFSALLPSVVVEPGDAVWSNLGGSVRSLVSIGNKSQALEYVITSTPGFGLTGRIQLSIASNAGMRFLITALAPNWTTVVASITYDVPTPGPGSLVPVLLPSIFAEQEVGKIRIRIQNLGPGATKDINSISIVQTTLLSELVDYTVDKPCANPVMLLWHNEDGGWSQWLFEHSQDERYVYTETSKAKRQVLYADNVTREELEGLNSMFQPGTTYRTQVTDLLTAKGTSRRNGSQAYVIDKDENLTEVLVFPIEIPIKTKDLRFNFQCEIEYPERFLL